MNEITGLAKLGEWINTGSIAAKVFKGFLIAIVSIPTLFVFGGLAIAGHVKFKKLNSRNPEQKQTEQKQTEQKQTEQKVTIKEETIFYTGEKDNSQDRYTYTPTAFDKYKCNPEGYANLASVLGANKDSEIGNSITIFNVLKMLKVVSDRFKTGCSGKQYFEFKSFFESFKKDIESSKFGAFNKIFNSESTKKEKYDDIVKTISANIQTMEWHLTDAQYPQVRKLFQKPWPEIQELANSGHYNDVQEVQALIDKFGKYHADVEKPSNFDAVKNQLEGLVAAHETLAHQYFGKSWPEIATQVEGLISKFGNNGKIPAGDLKAAEDLMWKLLTYPGKIPPNECGKVYSQTIYLDNCCGVLFKMNLLKTTNVQQFIFATLEKCINILKDNDTTEVYHKVWDLVDNGIVGETSYDGARDKDILRKLLNIDNDENAIKQYDKKWTSLVQNIRDFDEKFYPTTQNQTPQDKQDK